MDPNAVAGMIFTLALGTLVGGFIILYPLTKRLAQPKPRDQGDNALSAEEVKQIREMLHALESEVQLVSERQNFVEQLLARRDAAPVLPSGTHED